MGKNWTKAELLLTNHKISILDQLKSAQRFII